VKGISNKVTTDSHALWEVADRNKKEKGRDTRGSGGKLQPLTI